MATRMEKVYAAHMAIACADPYDHEAYLASRERVEQTVTEVYGPPLFERVMEWLDDCNEVPRYADVHERAMQELKGELEEAAVRAAHASDLDIFGHCTQETKDAVADKFRAMLLIVDQMQAVTPELRRGDALTLAMLHAMKEKAADYGVELA
jgi:hypothetical protein